MRVQYGLPEHSTAEWRRSGEYNEWDEVGHEDARQKNIAQLPSHVN